MSSDEVQVRSLMPAPQAGLSAQDLVALGEDLAALGINESRAVVAELQELAAKMGLASADIFMTRLRRVVTARDAQLIRTILALPLLQLPRLLIGTTPYVSRDAVLALLQVSSNVGAVRQQ
jgi:hypothetical protein